MVTSLRKRDARIVPFDVDKITEAVFRAASAQGGTDRNTARGIAEAVTAALNEECAASPEACIPDVEHVQDLVERTLIETGHARTA